MNIKQTLQKKFLDGLFINKVYNIIIRKRLKIDLFYVVREGLNDSAAFNPVPKLSPCETMDITPADLKDIAAKGERDYSEERMLEMLAAGKKCLVIKHNSDIVGYGWYDVKNCESEFISFPLEEGEAYLFGARTYTAYRGKNLAPYMRHQLYTHLADMGRTKLYSISEFWNIASIKFKRKLGARNLKLWFKITLFDKFQWKFVLRDYSRKS